MVYFQNEIITLTYEPDLLLMRTQWHGFAGSKAYRHILGKYLQLVREREVQLWMSDNTDGKAIRQADQDWTAYKWAPQFAAAAQIRRRAVLMPKDVFNQMALDKINSMGREVFTFETEFFESEAEARAWLLQK